MIYSSKGYIARSGERTLEKQEFSFYFFLKKDKEEETRSRLTQVDRVPLLGPLTSYTCPPLVH